MAQITYQVVLSADGKHQVLITSDSADEATKALGWAQTVYDRLVERYGRAEGRQAEKSPTDEVGPPPDCAVHALPMVRQKGRRGFFWSCHQRNDDGTWCSYKPTDA